MGESATSDALNPLAILAELGLPPPVAVTRVTGGWDTALWRVDNGTARALRVFRAEQTESCHREAIVMRALSEAGIAVPSVIAEGRRQGRPALLLSWCPGRPLLDEVRARPSRIWALGRAMGEMHAQIHAVPLPESLRPELPMWDPKRADAKPGLQARLHVLGTASTVVLHLDYHPLNVMADRGVVTGVLDWANVALGDPRADLARTVSLLRLAPVPSGMPAPLVVALRIILEAAWRAGYRQQARANRFVDMAPFYVWAGGMMERDLEPKLGRPGVWLQSADLSRIHRWTTTWTQRAHRPAR